MRQSFIKKQFISTTDLTTGVGAGGGEQGEPLPHLPNSVAPLPRMCGPPLLNMLQRLWV